MKKGMRSNQSRWEYSFCRLARRCSTTELHPHFTYENGFANSPNFLLVRLFYPAHPRDQIRTGHSLKVNGSVNEDRTLRKSTRCVTPGAGSLAWRGGPAAKWQQELRSRARSARW